MIRFEKIYRYFPVLIVLIGLLVNGAMFYKYSKNERTLTHDETQYDLTAQSILAGQTFFKFFPDDREHDIGEMMLPGYAFLLALIYLIAGHHIVAVYLFQVIASIFAALLLYHIMKRHTGPVIGFISSLWLIAYYPLWAGSFMLMRESIVASILIMTLYLLDKYVEKKELNVTGENSIKTSYNKYLYLFALTFGLLICIGNRFILHFVFFMLYMFYQLVRKRLKWQAFILCGLITGAVLLPWHIRQYIVYKRPVIFGPIYSEGTAKGDSSRPFLSYEDARDEVMKGGHNPRGKAYFENHFTPQRYEQMKQNYHAFSGFGKYLSRFMGFWEVYTRDIRFGFGGDTRIAVPSSSARKFSNLILFAPMILFFLIGFIVSLFKRNHLFTIIGLFIIAHVLLHTLVHYIPRYRVTIIPLIFMLGWYGVSQIFEIFNKKVPNGNK